MICYLSADLVDSTSSTWTPDGFEAALGALRDDLREVEAVDIEVSQGDSFQLQCPARYAWAVAIVSYARMRTHGDAGARVAFAVGEGDTTVNRPLSLRDGAVYRRAGRGVGEIREKGLPWRFFPDESVEVQAGWRTASDYAGILLAGTTQRQCELLCAALAPHVWPNQKKIAKRLELAESTVSQHLRAANLATHFRSSQRFSMEVAKQFLA